MEKRFQVLVMIFSLFGSLFLSDFTRADESHPGIGIESRYAEAVLAYNRKQPQEALRILEEILASLPRAVAALELKALVLKTQGDDHKAIDAYLKLIQLKPEKERGPYYFEIGVILYRMKQSLRSHEYLERAILLHFNAAAAHLFLGMMDFGAGKADIAEQHFVEVRKSGLPEMQVVARYYLGLIDMKEGAASSGASEWLQAKILGLTLPDSKMASDTVVSIDHALEPFTRGQWFGNVTLLLQYDSNISETPSASTVQSQASQNATAQVVASGGVGYISPALNPIQWVPSYQFSYNKNFNSATQGFEYFSNIGAVYFNYKALAETTAGIKLQGSYIFQNQPDDTQNPNGSYTLSKYSLAGELGPYVKTQLSSCVSAEAELYIRPQDFYSQSALSGTSYLGRFTLQERTSKLYLNPGVSVSLENESSSSDQLKYRSAAVSAFDMVRLTPRDTFTLGLDFTRYDYYETNPSRADTTLNPHLSWLHALTDKWALVGDLNYTANSSTIATSYSYNRFVIGAGISRSL